MSKATSVVKNLFVKLQKTSLVVGLALAAAPAQAETLADAMVSAYNHSGLLEQNRAVLRAADEDVALAVTALRPVINWAGSVERSWSTSQSSPLLGTNSASGTTAGLNIVGELLLYDFGRSKIRIDIAKETVLSTRQTLIAVEQSVLLRAARAFFEVRRQRAFLGLAESNVRVITQELRAARDRFEVGEVTRTDVSLAEARLAAANAGLASAQGDLVISMEEYRNVTGHKPKSLSRPPAVPRTAKNPPAAAQVAMRHHPDMLKAQHDVTAGELGVVLAKAGRKPSVSLTGRYGISETFNSDNFSRSGAVGVEMSGPIYQGGRLNALERQAMARRDAVRGGLHVVRHDIRQNVGRAFAQLQVAHARRDATNRQVRAATVAFRGVREEAKLGSRTTLDVLNAEQELRDAQASLISAEIDEHVAAYSLLSQMGLLTTERLKLKVQRYDPAAYYNLAKDAPLKRSKQGQKLDQVLKALGKE